MKYLKLLIIALTVQGCVTIAGDQIRSEIRPGTSKERVIEVLGQPDGFEIVDGKEVLTYTNRLMSVWSWDTTDYHFVIENNKVISYGTGEVRVKPTNKPILIVPLK